MFNSKYALVCESLPKSLINGLSLNQHDPVDVEKAIQQHQEYLQVLEKNGVNLIRINAREEYPDCVFVEDTAIAVKNRIFITNLMAPTRKGEIDQIDAAFRNMESTLNLKIGKVDNVSEAFIDGGDCLFTGREFIVGLSSRTNQKGVEELQKFFHDIPVITCKVNRRLHLKSFMSMLDNDVILISSSEEARSIRQEIELKSSHFESYKFVEVPIDQAANVLCFNGVVVAPVEHKSQYENTAELKHDPRVQWIHGGEFEKIDGSLSCRSIFFDNRAN